MGDIGHFRVGDKEQAPIAAAAAPEWTMQVVLSLWGYGKDAIQMYSLKTHIQCF